MRLSLPHEILLTFLLQILSSIFVLLTPLPRRRRDSGVTSQGVAARGHRLQRRFSFAKLLVILLGGGTFLLLLIGP